MATPKNLISKLSEILGTVERIEKKGRNTFHNYQYVMEADLVEAVRQKLSAANIFVTASAQRTEVLDVNRTNGKTGETTIVTVPLLFVEYTFHDGDSQETLNVWGVGEIDQDGGKGIYKAQTGAMKYMLMKNFLIATGDDPEQDNRKKPDQKAAEPGPRASGYNRANDRGYPASAPQVKRIDWEWSELTNDEAERMRANLERLGIRKEKLTKAQASFIIDEIIALKKSRRNDAGGGSASTQGSSPKPPAPASPRTTGGQGGPMPMTTEEMHHHDSVLRSYKTIGPLDSHMEDVRAMPKTKAMTDFLERSYTETRDAIFSRHP